MARLDGAFGKGNYVVIFRSLRTAEAGSDYIAMAEKIEALAKEQPGYCGIFHAHNRDGTSVTISYWADEAAVKAWRRVAEHQDAQQMGRSRWYEKYAVEVAQIERAYDFLKE